MKFFSDVQVTVFTGKSGEQEAEDFKLANWNDTIASHPKIELHLFHIKFWSTIKKVAECGHSRKLLRWPF